MIFNIKVRIIISHYHEKKDGLIIRFNQVLKMKSPSLSL